MCTYSLLWFICCFQPRSQKCSVDHPAWSQRLHGGRDGTLSARRAVRGEEGAGEPAGGGRRRGCGGRTLHLPRELCHFHCAFTVLFDDSFYFVFDSVCGFWLLAGLVMWWELFGIGGHLLEFVGVMIIHRAPF